MYDRKCFGKKAEEWYLKINGNQELGIQASFMPRSLDDVVTMMHSIENHYGADRFEEIITKLGGIAPRAKDFGTRMNIEKILKGEYDWSDALIDQSKRSEWKVVLDSEEVQIASRAAEIYRVIASGEMKPKGEDDTFNASQVIGIMSAGGNVEGANRLRSVLREAYE